MTGLLKTDLYLARGDNSSFSDRTPVDFKIERGDVKLTTHSELISQSIANRLLTRKEELTGLGHPDYGSRLYKLVGEPNNLRTASLADLYIRETLKDDQTIEEVVDISVFAKRKNEMTIKLVILIKNEEKPITLSMHYEIGG